uniref:Uncharacterized protein n=1 Tax=viral metagenome TaxID=1070528 RepID=A0A6M3M460_9ZZZZ
METKREQHGGVPKLADAVEVSGAAKLKELRDVVAPPGKKGLWLRHLSDRQLVEVYQRLMQRQSINHIVKICQVEWGIMRRSQPRSLSRGMVAFREKVVGDVRIPGETKAEDKALAKLAKRGRALAKVDGVETMSWAVQVQVERIRMRLEKEVTVGMPLADTDKGLELLRNLCDTYLSFQIKLGLLEAKAPDFEVSVKHRFEQLVGAAQQGSGGLPAMIEATDRLLTGLEKEVVPLELGEDGKYKVKKND